MAILPNGVDNYEDVDTFPLTLYYGILVGAAFTIPISVCGIFMGYISDRINRVVLLGMTCILWSAMTSLSAISCHFWSLVLTRILLGVF